MSRAERQRFRIAETKERVFERDNWTCQVCGRPVTPENGQLAHIIPQTKTMVRKYGREIVHDDLNLMTTCSLACNDRVSAGNQPRLIEQLAEAIREERQRVDKAGGERWRASG